MPRSAIIQPPTVSSLLQRHQANGRSALLPALLEVQAHHGHLSEGLVEEVGRALRVPLAEIHGVIEFYSLLYSQPFGETFVRICTGPVCAQAGGRELVATTARSLGLTSVGTAVDRSVTLEAAPCLGLCDHAPAALVGETPVGAVGQFDAGHWWTAPRAAPLGRTGGEPRWLTGRCGEVDPTSLEDYRALGGYAGLERALWGGKPEQVVREVKAAGLLGRGGAAFPTGSKLEMTAQAPGDERFIVCNGDESEPGTFKDRILLEGDPFFVLEGMTLAGYAVGASKGMLYVRGEYPRAQAILRHAIGEARRCGYLGPGILGSGFSFDIELRSGAGAYICGEETALFESIEGKRGFPRLKTPFPTTHGLYGKPTAINNVETLCSLAWIVTHGADAYRSVGTSESPGSKIFCLSGDIAFPGAYEVPYGTPLRHLLDLAGGITGKLQAVLLGGAAGAFARPDQLDLPMSFEALRAAGLPLGSGVVMALRAERDLKMTLVDLAEFFAHESCGKCFPCQLGTQRQLEIMRKVAAGSATRGDISALQDVGFAMTQASLCGLGMTAASAIQSALDNWPELFGGGRAL